MTATTESEAALRKLLNHFHVSAQTSSSSQQAPQDDIVLVTQWQDSAAVDSVHLQPLLVPPLTDLWPRLWQWIQTPPAETRDSPDCLESSLLKSLRADFALFEKSLSNQRSTEQGHERSRILKEAAVQKWKLQNTQLADWCQLWQTRAQRWMHWQSGHLKNPLNGNEKASIDGGKKAMEELVQDWKRNENALMVDIEKICQEWIHHQQQHVLSGTLSFGGGFPEWVKRRFLGSTAEAASASLDLDSQMESTQKVTERDVMVAMTALLAQRVDRLATIGKSTSDTMGQESMKKTLTQLHKMHVDLHSERDRLLERVDGLKAQVMERVKRRQRAGNTASSSKIPYSIQCRALQQTMDHLQTEHLPALTSRRNQLQSEMDAKKDRLALVGEQYGGQGLGSMGFSHHATDSRLQDLVHSLVAVKRREEAVRDAKRRLIEEKLMTHLREFLDEFGPVDEGSGRADNENKMDERDANGARTVKDKSERKPSGRAVFEQRLLERELELYNRLPVASQRFLSRVPSDSPKSSIQSADGSLRDTDSTQESWMDKLRLSEQSALHRCALDSKSVHPLLKAMGLQPHHCPEEAFERLPELIKEGEAWSALEQANSKRWEALCQRRLELARSTTGPETVSLGDCEQAIQTLFSSVLEVKDRNEEMYERLGEVQKAISVDVEQTRQAVDAVHEEGENMFLDPERVYKMVSREAMQYNQLAMANIGK